MSGMFTDFDGSDNNTSALFFMIEPIPFMSPSTAANSSYSAEPTRNSLEELFLPVDSSYYQYPAMLPSASIPTQPPESFVSSNEVSLSSRTEYYCGDDELLLPNSTRPPKPKRSRSKSQSSSSQGTRDSRVLTKEEARRLKNRESAAKSRRRAHETVRALEDTLTELQQRHEFLQNELQRLLAQRGLVVEATTGSVTGVR